MTAWDADRFAKWVRVLEHRVREREVAVRLVLLAVCARTHVLLLGDPGTGKSMLAQHATGALTGNLFTTLLTKFSVPEDVLGPLSLRALEDGRYERLVDHYLPTADVAFVDEVYKANAAILNALLSILNERKLFDGSRVIDVPLRSMVAASNEVPEEDEGLDALDDRLLLRVRVESLDDRTLYALVRGRGGEEPAVPPPLDAAWLEELRERAKHVRVEDRVAQLILSVLKAVREKIYVSDRRVLQVVDVLKHMAALDGEGELLPIHLGLLRYALWRRLEHRAVVDAAFDSVVLDPAAVPRAEKLLEQLRERVAQWRGYYRQQLDESLELEIVAKVGDVDQEVRRLADRREELVRGGTSLWNAFWPTTHVSLDGVARRRAELVEAIRPLSADLAGKLTGPPRA